MILFLVKDSVSLRDSRIIIKNHLIESLLNRHSKQSVQRIQHEHVCNTSDAIKYFPELLYSWSTSCASILEYWMKYTNYERTVDFYQYKFN